MREAFTPASKVLKKYRYYCFACTGRVIYAPEPFHFEYAVCGECAKVHDSSNYAEENWLPMSEEEIQEKNNL